MENVMKFRELKYGQGFMFADDEDSTYYVKQWRNLYIDPNIRYSRPQSGNPDAMVSPK
jgi:hypothetical protein